MSSGGRVSACTPAALSASLCSKPYAPFLPCSRTKSGRALSSSRRKSRIWPSLLEPVPLHWIDLYDEPEMAVSKLTLRGQSAQWARALDARPEFSSQKTRLAGENTQIIF